MNNGELGYLLAQRNPNQLSRSAGAGASELGLALGGAFSDNSQHFRDVRDDRAARVGRTEEALARARAAVKENIGRESLAIRAEKNGDSELAALIRGSRDINPNTYYEGMGRKQANDYQQKAWELAQAPGRDWGSLNADLAVLNKKPVQVQRALGDGMYTSNAYEPTTAPSVTPVGSAKISELGALMQEHGAQAARARAGIGADKASNYEIVDTPNGKMRVNKLNPSDTTPVLFNGNPVAKSVAAGKGFTETEMGAAFGPGPDGKGVDPVKLDAFLAKKNAMPNASDAAVYAGLKDDQQAAAQEGPPSSLAPEEPGLLSRLFGGGSASTQSPATPAASKPSTPSSQADFDALPSGSLYVNPSDGKTYRKKNVVRTGTSADGRRVAQYDDGAVDYTGQ